MEKQLILLRHGKSDWSADYSSDQERPLARRGKLAARTIGKFLAIIGATPDLALVSPARRTSQTFQIAAKSGNWSCPYHFAPALYNGDIDSILPTIIELPDSVSNILLVSHEPMGSAMLQWLVGPCHVKLPTATLSCVGLNSQSWQGLCSGDGQLLWLLPPRLLAKILGPQT